MSAVVRRNKKTPTSQACADRACPHAARLETALTENIFLGETVENLQQALQMADQLSEKYRDEICRLTEALERYEQARANQKHELQENQVLQQRLQAKLDECRQLRADKTELIQQSWASLRHVADIRQRNDQLEKQLGLLQHELDRSERKSTEGGDISDKPQKKEVQETDEGHNRSPSWNNDEIDTIREQIEILEKQALASKRLQQDLVGSEERCRILQLRLDECTRQYNESKELVALYNERESVLLEQLKREMLANSQY